MGDEEERSGSLMVALPVVLTKSHVTMLKSMVTGIGDIDARKQFRLTYPCFSLSTYIKYELFFVLWLARKLPH